MIRTFEPLHRVPGVLVLYHKSVVKTAATIMEHVRAFSRYSAFPVWNVNTEYEPPPALASLRFAVIVLHYSIFGTYPHQISRAYREYLRQDDHSYKIAFFQDEYRFCRERFDFIDRHRIDCIFSLLESPYLQEAYGRCPRAKTLVTTLTGYVDEGLLAAARTFAKPDDERPIDVGYRARPLEYYMGRGAREKTDIADGFERYARGPGKDLTFDIATDEESRVYGDSWYAFLGSCKCVLGVESGVSVFDLDGRAQAACRAELERDPAIDFETVWRNHLEHLENRIPYRKISPRHFEAAAFRTCQILFEGAYQGILRPDEHYVELRKDFSNVDDVLARIRDGRERRRITEKAYDDLIESGDYHYRSFVRRFDEVLETQGIHPPNRFGGYSRIARRLRPPRAPRWRTIRYRREPFRRAWRRAEALAGRLLRYGGRR